MSFSGTSLGIVLDIVKVVIGLVLYFLPSIVAAARQSKKLAVVVLVNLFLGWSFIGWVVAFVIALTSSRQPSR